MKRLVLLIAFISIISVALSSEHSVSIEYQNLTKGDYNDFTVDISISAIGHLFVMSRQFVNIVFEPFSVLEEFIYNLLVRGSGEGFLNELLSRWQLLASYEIGFMSCFIIGCFFIILVPLIGLILCISRCCCHKCGGDMIQSRRRAESKWKCRLCVSLLVVTIFIAIPCSFVFVTNEWMTQVVKAVPQQTSATLGDVVTYVDSVPKQLHEIVGQYRKLDESLRKNVRDLGTSLGVPIRDVFYDFTDPTFHQLMRLNNVSKDALDALNEVSASTTELNNGVTTLNNELSRVKTALDTTLNKPDCTNFPACNSLRSSTSALNPSGADFSSLGDIQTQINNIQNALNFDIPGEIQNVKEKLNDIPGKVDSSSSEATTKVLGALTDVNNTLTDSLDKLPVDTLNQLIDTVKGINSTVRAAATSYAEYDKYRYMAGLTLGLTITLVVVCYFLGMTCGTLGYASDRTPATRTCISNCGGLFLVSGVVFSFLFAWLLMILITLGFTVGGHSERYICQNFEPPYEGLKFADRVVDELNLTEIISSTINVSIYQLITDCKNDASLYKAIKLEKLFNITGMVEETMSQTTGFSEKLDTIVVDLNDVDVFPSEIENALNSMASADLADVNFDSYLSEVDKGLTSGNLMTLANSLNENADQFPASLSSFADELRGHATSIEAIQQNNVEPLSGTSSRLRNSVNNLNDISSGLNNEITGTKDELRLLDNKIKTNGTKFVKEQVLKYANGIIGDITGYVDWSVLQLTDNLGACKPLYSVYTQVISLLCDYLVDTLNGLWFSLGWCVIFLIPASVLALKLSKFYRRMELEAATKDDQWNDLEMNPTNFQESNNSSKKEEIPKKFKSGKVHPGDYY